MLHIRVSGDQIFVLISLQVRGLIAARGAGIAEYGVDKITKKGIRGAIGQ